MEIKLRQDLHKKFNVNVLNMGDVPMGAELMLQLYSRKIGRSPYEVKKLRTPRDKIELKDCIPYWCNIKSKEFNVFLNKLKKTVVRGEKGEFQFSVIFHNYKLYFGLGGKNYDCLPY